MDSLQPAGDDAALDRCLETLPVFAPGPGFEDRVLARVMMPAPRWLRTLRRTSHALVDSRRIWWLAGGLAGASAVAVAAVTVLVVTNTAVVGGIVGWATESIGLPLWRAVLGIVSQVARDSYAQLSTLVPSGPRLLAAMLASTAFLTFNAWMVYRLMQPGQAKGAEPHAVR